MSQLETTITQTINAIQALTDYTNTCDETPTTPWHDYTNHGTRNLYNTGCRCSACRNANRVWSNAHRQKQREAHG